MACIILNDDIVLSETHIGRLPVFTAMMLDIETREQINVLVSEDMSAPDILRYASCKEDIDYVLPSSHTDVVRRTLDWCGVDIGDLRTPRELHEELRDKTVQLEKQKTAMSDVAHLDYVEFVCPIYPSIFVWNQFDFTKCTKNNFNVKTMDELITSWKTDINAAVLLTKTYRDNNSYKSDRSIISISKLDELYKVISAIRDMHGCQRVVKLLI